MTSKILFFQLFFSYLASSSFIAEGNNNGDQECHAQLRVTRYLKRQCYLDSSSGCFDQCKNISSPSVDSLCFQEITIPCEVIANIHSESFDDKGLKIIGLEQLYSYEIMSGTYGIGQKELYDQIREEYGLPASQRPLSISKEELLKQNYKLQLLENVENMYQITSDAASFSRYILGKQSLVEADKDLLDLKKRIELHPIFSEEQAAEVISDLDRLRDRKLSLWNSLEGFDIGLFVLNRRILLSNLLKKIKEQSERLPEARLKDSVEKIVLSTFLLVDKINPVCSTHLENSPTCWELDNLISGNYSPIELDRLWNLIEPELLATLRHATVLEAAYETRSSLGTGISQDIRVISSLEKSLELYLYSPSQAAINRLEAAINLGSGANAPSATEYFDKGAKNVVARISSTASYIRSYNSQSFALCEDYQQFNQETSDISFARRKLINELRSLLRSETSERRERMGEIIQELRNLAFTMKTLTGYLGTSNDRRYEMVWHLPQIVIEDMINDSFQIELLTMDGMFWNSNQSLNLVQIFSDIEKIETVRSMISPRGYGRFSRASQRLSFKVSRSAYSACSPFSDNQVRIIISYKSRKTSKIARINLSGRWEEL